jgi:hypothetical protein
MDVSHAGSPNDLRHRLTFGEHDRQWQGLAKTAR